MLRFIDGISYLTAIMLILFVFGALFITLQTIAYKLHPVMVYEETRNAFALR